ncbi:ferredoxin [Betaproteobacteria bacterium]|nr:ferredoxin [Betaproteobacteria bacterium]GHU09594.1 ferredoxin [Betaproteobacteria bacterium]GHU23412.1 ferredoxin [Betaproteobacteria bacterium]GHU33285.1 ferredoxin [Betaproteobacteria bacterium]GHU48130.1 ferredoxin [Betaproteobacteria bacterium]
MPKAKVTFADNGVTVTVPAGTRLIEVSEQAGAGIVYGCREGDCGACLTQVVSGGENLAEASVLEDETLKNMLARRDQRLACQAQVLGGEIVVNPLT